MRNITHALTAAALLVSAACTVHDTSVPPISGPSQLSISLRMSATPDTVPQDGASQSTIVIQAFDAVGQPKTTQLVRTAVFSGGGTLSAASVVTGSDGKATVVFTAPAPGPNAFPLTATVRAETAGSDAAASVPFEVKINLPLVGGNPPVITVPNTTPPTADFTFSPTKPFVGQNVFFNGSQSTAAVGRFIAQYRWDFGDGVIDTTSGVSVSHQFALQGTYNVSLTAIDDAGGRGTKINSVDVSLGLPTVIVLLSKTANVTAGTAPAGGVCAPATPCPTVQADVSGTLAAGTATITSYTIIWGDGTQTVSATPLVSHVYPPVVPPATNTYTVTVRATDSVGRVGTGSQAITVP